MTDTPEKAIAAAPEKKIEETVSAPSEKLLFPVVPLKEGILFPITESVLTFGRDISLQGIRVATQSPQKMVVLVAQRRQNIKEPKIADLYTVGTLALVERTIKTDDTVNALVRGIGRVKIQQFTKQKPYL
jgi:ATP-dependent Lon protease